MKVWTEKDKDTIARMMSDGATSAQIGAALGVTKNSIIGVVGRTPRLKEIGFRLKFGPQGARKTVKGQQKPVRRTIAPSAVVQLFEPKPIETVETFDGATVGQPLVNIRETQCKWPVNDAERGQEHLFCAKPRAGHSKAYCSHHHSMAYGGGTYAERTAHKGIAA